MLSQLLDQEGRDGTSMKHMWEMKGGTDEKQEGKDNLGET
jgi:hypothetical protein